ncbi:MAG: hypothetical protein HQL98_07240 [Magnetococcales bacterium]|nr:hypothetical protein [Magnetococcales bacterium]
MSSQSNVGEESITDWFLYSLTKHIPYVRYHKFTRREEGKTTGADWEWWFIDGCAGIGLRVQAKRLDKNDNYPSLAYANKYGLQIDTLIKDAHAKNLLPFYALYSALHFGSQPFKTKCGGMPSKGIDEGVFLSEAIPISNQYIKGVKQVIGWSVLLNDAMPASCLFCCPMAHSNGIKGLQMFFGDCFSKTITEYNNSNTNSPGYFNEIPDYVRSFMKGEEGSDGWERDFRSQLPEVDGMIVVDLSRNKCDE